MKIGELLRQLAAIVDSEEEVGAASDTPGELMVSPLQQAHELLKKSNGVENNVDVFAADDPKELARLQQMAGIQPAAQAPVLNQTIVINNTGAEPTVQSTPIVPEPVAETVVEPAKPVKQMTYEDNYNEAVIDVGDAFDKLREEFEAISVKKGKK